MSAQQAASITNAPSSASSQTQIHPAAQRLIDEHPITLHSSSLSILSTIPLQISNTIIDISPPDPFLLGEHLWIYTHKSLPGSISYTEVGMRTDSFHQDVLALFADDSKSDEEMRDGYQQKILLANKRIRDKVMRYRWHLQKEQRKKGEEHGEDGLEAGKKVRNGRSKRFITKRPER
ncbi:hypothetical protein BDZ91DRAFT_766786 [Kalaharituber pfeilii]|nr:hypothetical protein BDZ91DRAFT_766786 [Kalaharituber pfeilii]